MLDIFSERVIIKIKYEVISIVNAQMRPVTWKKRTERDADGGSILQRFQEKTSSERSLIGSGDSVIVRMRGWIAFSVKLQTDLQLENEIQQAGWNREAWIEWSSLARCQKTSGRGFFYVIGKCVLWHKTLREDSHASEENFVSEATRRRRRSSRASFFFRWVLVENRQSLCYTRRHRGCFGGKLQIK